MDAVVKVFEKVLQPGEVAEPPFHFDDARMHKLASLRSLLNNLPRKTFFLLFKFPFFKYFHLPDVVRS